MTTNRADIYTRVTDRIIAELERGVRPWVKPWNANHAAGRMTPPLRHNGVPYRGINVLLLWGESVTKGFGAPMWMTYRQALELKALRQGEHGSLVVYADRFTTTETNDRGQDVEREIPFLKGYTVFNIEQIDGLPEHYYAKREPQGDTLRLLERAESFFAATGAVVRHTGHQAYYSPSADVVVLPVPDAFSDAESYASTKAHELTHWTKHPTRLDRNLGGSRFGDDGYAREELVAELGSAFLCADLGITLTPRDDHASYIDHWLQVLRADTRAIFQAASHAQRASDYLHGLQAAPRDAD